MVRHTPGCCYTSRTRYDIYRVPLVLVWYATSVGTRFYGTIIAWRRHHTIILVIVKTVKISTKTTLKITFEISYDSFADVQKIKKFCFTGARNYIYLSCVLSKEMVNYKTVTCCRKTKENHTPLCSNKWPWYIFYDRCWPSLQWWHASMHTGGPLIIGSRMICHCKLVFCIDNFKNECHIKLLFLAVV